MLRLLKSGAIIGLVFVLAASSLMPISGFSAGAVEEPAATPLVTPSAPQEDTGEFTIGGKIETPKEDSNTTQAPELIEVVNTTTPSPEHITESPDTGLSEQNSTPESTSTSDEGISSIPDTSTMATGNETVTSTLMSGHRGTFVELTGIGFEPLADVEMYWDLGGTPDYHYAQVDADGVFELGTTVPGTAPTGVVFIRIATTDASYSTSIDFTVTCCAPALLSVNPTYGVPGDRLTLVGSGFLPSETVDIRHNSETGTILTSTTSASDGGIYLELAIPNNASAGQNTFWATSGSGHKGNVEFTVSDPSSPNLYLSFSEGHPNGIIPFNGNNFQPGESVSVYQGSVNGALLTVTTASPNGEINGQFTLVNPTPNTSYEIAAEGSQGTAIATFQTDSNAALFVSVSPAVVAPGNSITVTGTGFPSSQGVDIFLGQIMMWPDYSVIAAGDGSFTTTIEIPGDHPSGKLDVFVRDYMGFYVTQTISIEPEIVPTAVSVTTMPSSGLAGSFITVSASGFVPNELVTFRFSGYTGTLLGSGYADVDGSVTDDLQIPPGAAVTKHWLTAEGESGRRSYVGFIVTAPPKAEIQIDPASGTAGTSVLVTGDGFAPDELVTYRFSGYSGRVLATSYSDSNGRISNFVTIPIDASAVNHWVSAEGVSGKRDATLFEVTGPPIANVFVYPDSGVAGSTISISGEGFTPNNIVTFRFSGYNGQYLGASQADAEGNVYADLRIPPLAKITNHWVSAEDSKGKRDATLFSVTGGPEVQIQVSPTSGLAGSSVLVWGDGFVSNELVTFRFSGYKGTILGTARADETGAASTFVTIPPRAAVTKHWVTAQGSSGIRDAVYFTVTGIPEASLIISPSSGLAGSTVTFMGSGFVPDEAVTFRISGYKGTYLGSASANDEGRVNETLRIPESAKSTSYWLTAEGTSGRRDAQLFTVTGSPAVQINLSPTLGLAGSSVWIQADGFVPNERVTFRFSGYSGTYLGADNADATGAVSTFVEIPPNAATVNHWVTAEGNSGRRSAVLFTVTGPPANALHMFMSPSSGPAGSTTWINAEGFAPNERVTFRFSGYNGTLLGSKQADSDGYVIIHLRIPPNAKVTNHWVTAEGTSGKRTTLLYSVTGPPKVQVETYPTDGAPGLGIMVTGDGFEPNEYVTIRFSGYGGTILGTTNADSLGSISAFVLIPSNAQPVQHWITAEGTSGKRGATLFLVMTP